MTVEPRKRPPGAPSILFLARDLEIGGAQRQLIELAAGLRERGWDVLVATFYAGGALEGELERTGVRTVCLRKNGRWEIVSFLVRLAGLIRRERPRFAYGLLGMPNILLALLRPFSRGTRIVWGIAASDMDLSQYDAFMRTEFRLSVMFSRCADLMISNSRAGLAYHVSQGYPRERMTVVPNGIDVERFRPDEAGRRRVRAEWGVAPGETLIGLIGRLDPMKDHANFLRAAAQVAAERPATRFVCVGDGTAAYRNRLESLARELCLGERLIWAGTRSDIAQTYNALDLKVCSSVSEGLPNAVAEAMATGVPCVVTDVGDCAELLGGLGWVCPPRDSAALAEAMARAVDALPCDAARIRQRICKNYSVKVQVDRTIAELSQLMESETACPERNRSTTGC